MTYALQNINVSSSSTQNSSLKKAIEGGDLRTIQSLVKQGNPVNSLLPSKELPLHAVVRSVRFPTNQDKIEAVRLFIQSGANFEAKDIDDLTALDHAIHLQNIPLAKVMISEKIGIASEIIKNQVEIKRTSDSLADVNERLQQKTAVDPKELGSLQKAAYEGNVEELKKAAKNKQSNASAQLRLNQLDKHGLAPIHYAVLGNQEDAFQTLLTLGADPKVLTRDKDTIIHLTALNKSSSLLKKALDSKVDLNYQNTRGETALHYAFLREHWETIQTLMQKGADPLIADLQGMSPPAAFVSMSMQKDPLLISSKNLVQTVFEVLFLWQLQSQDFKTLSQFRSWPAALTASFFGVLAAKAMPLIKQKQMSSIASLAKECIPGLGLGWTAKRTYNSFSSSFQKVARSWNYLGYRTLDALPSLVMESLAGITSVALIGMQAAVHANVLRPRQENGLSAPGIQGDNFGTGSVVDSVILPQSDPARETLSLLAPLPLPIPEMLKKAISPKVRLEAHWFIGLLRKPTLFDIPKPPIDLRDAVAPKALTYLQKDIEQEAMFPYIGSIISWLGISRLGTAFSSQSSVQERSAIVPTFSQDLNIRLPNKQLPQTKLIAQLPETASKGAPFPQSSIYLKHTIVPTELHQQTGNRTQNTPYPAQESFVNFGSTNQSKIDPEAKDLYQTGNAGEKGRLSQVAAIQYSQYSKALGSESATDASNSSYLLKKPENISDIHWGHVDTNIEPSQQQTPKSNFAPYVIKIGSPFLLKFLHNTYNWISNLLSNAGSKTPPATDSSQDLPKNIGKDDSSLHGNDSPKPSEGLLYPPIEFGGSHLSFLGRSSSMPNLFSSLKKNRVRNHLEEQIFSRSDLIFTSEGSLITAATLNEKKRDDSSSRSNSVLFDETRDSEQDIINSMDPNLSLESHSSHSSTVPQPSQHTPEDNYRVLTNLVSPTLLVLLPQDDLQREATTTYELPVPSNLENFNDLEATQQPEPSVYTSPQQAPLSSLPKPINSFDASSALSAIKNASLEEEEDYQVTIATLFDEAENSESNEAGRIASYSENIAQKESPDSEENTISSPPQMRRSRSLSSELSAVPPLSRSSSGSSVYDLKEALRLADRFNATLQPNQQALETLFPDASDTNDQVATTTIFDEVENSESTEEGKIGSPSDNDIIVSPKKISDSEENPISSPPQISRPRSFSSELSAVPSLSRSFSGSSVYDFAEAFRLADRFNANLQSNQEALETPFPDASDTNDQAATTTIFDEVENSESNEKGKIASPADNDIIVSPKKISDSEENPISNSPVPQNQNAISRPRTLGCSLSSSLQSPPVPSLSRSASSNSVYHFTGLQQLTGLFNTRPQSNQPQSLATIVNTPDTLAAPTTPPTILVERDNDQMILPTPLIEEASSDPNTLEIPLPVENVASPTPTLSLSEADAQASESEMESTPHVLVTTSVENPLPDQSAATQPDGQVDAIPQLDPPSSLEMPVDVSDSPAPISTIQDNSAVKKRPKSRSRSDIRPSPNKEKNETLKRDTGKAFPRDPITTTASLGKDENANPNPQQKNTNTQPLVRRKLTLTTPLSQAQPKQPETPQVPQKVSSWKKQLEEDDRRVNTEPEKTSKRPKVPSTDLEMDAFPWAEIGTSKWNK